MATKNQYTVEVSIQLVNPTTGKKVKQTFIRTATATSRQSAVRQVLRSLIGGGYLDKQPPTTNDGWWEGVECTMV